MLSPAILRELFGNNLKGLWWLDENALDHSGNGHDGVPTNVEFGQPSLAPGLEGGGGRYLVRRRVKSL